ncbi:hypothetical protein [Jiella avicenniae]|uniref:Tungsten formylmethanofuran dehydrogenase n=1 Tax=Jiella avicenniae TaxID=2907202 RepID=A0A9X1T410_9HYPH|nr:hypothetical protein [Jiella avicenniae]MCE7028166.1 hypothetical protein [Jiella avicenniae]
MTVDTAWIDGRPATLEDALQAAAGLLDGSRLPFVGGLRTDVAGLRSALSLARRIGAVVDHRLSAAIYPFIVAARENGAFLAAPAEMRRRADRVVVMGDEAAEIGADVIRMLTDASPDLGIGTRGSERLFMTLGSKNAASPGSTASRHVDCASSEIVDVLGMVRAGMAGRRSGEGALGEETVATITSFLTDAGFCCIVFSPAEFGELGTEQIFGLVADLNETTRASTLPVLAAADAMGAALQATWTAGFPLRFAFGRGAGEHDAALNAGERQLSGAGEADLAILIDALDGAAPAEAKAAIPTIAITADPASAGAARIAFHVATAGRDYDGVLYEPRFGSFVAKAAQRNSELPSAAAILDALTEQLGERARDAA